MEAILRTLLEEKEEAEQAAWSLQQKLKLVEAENERLKKENAVLVTTLAGVEKRKARAV